MSEVSKYFENTFSYKTQPKTDSKYVFISGNFRFSVLTSRLLRVEFSQDMDFCDDATQAVLFRNFDTPEFEAEKKANEIIIKTKYAQFNFDTKSRQMKSVKLKNQKPVTNFEKGNLLGTFRTLDMVNGKCKLEKGLMSRSGVSVYDDSSTVIINSDGTIGERRPCEDKYYFAYGDDYRACIKDFYKLSGEVPLVPRFCLGNWWSRYKAYTQDEYIALMKQFKQREIPITVATVDMDWHWVDVEKRFLNGNILDEKKPLFLSEGWTGYSWNTELFPDYKGFLKWLKNENLKVTLNLHPAQGVRSFENMYEEMAEAMGINPETKQTIKFDIASPKFIDAYFNILHKPYENDGVDFWWIDWQQEKTTKIKGLDPLWALNHYHTLAFNGTGKRPLILSRFAQVGSHRYPLGFSGDTFMTWQSLDFQPYFTANAANIGYTWWSHDIGGHHLGERDDELFIRWIQLGLYSPIMRLHSTNDEFMGKEPWKYSFAANIIASDILRQRHSMIPYLYSMNYRTHNDAIALCEPMYYSYPKQDEAYEVKNQYFFGSELIAAPITTKINKTTLMGHVKVWLPSGEWTDIYNGNIYEGNRYIGMYRGIESIPVLAKEGAIIPMSKNSTRNDWKNPENMIIRIFLGDNKFALYEDDGETEKYKTGEYAITYLTQKLINNENSFDIYPAKGDVSVLPQSRNYTLIFENVRDAEEICVKVDCNAHDYEMYKKDDKMYIELNDISPKNKVELVLKNIVRRENRDKKEYITEIISKYQMKTVSKKVMFSGFIKDIQSGILSCNKALKGPIEEILKLK